MGIRIHDTLARSVVDLDTREPSRVSMYACGPTVYGFVHVGNARTMLWYDLIRSYLGYRGYAVSYVMNYTDVDDKIIERAKLEGLPPDGVAKKYAAAFEEDMDALRVRPPDILVRATDHIDDMVKAIQGLIEKGVAYAVNGDVFFSVEAFPDYGKLSHRSRDDMRAGERVEPHRAKRSPLDFALWKAAKEGEPAWESPWGPGRPGWHIECSVMSTKYLGMGFDIHGGATDLIFPHHENEIAQAEALGGGEQFVRHWMHAGLVQMESDKMSKSLGNFVLARDVLEEYPGEVVRYWAITGSYRSQVVFSDASLADSAQAYDRWKTFVEAAGHALGEEGATAGQKTRPIGDENAHGPAGRYVSDFIAAMDDDFNSAGALSALHELVREGNKRLEAVQRGDREAREEVSSLVATFCELTSVLGFDFATDQDASALTGRLIDYLLELREQARSEDAFDRADEIRARLGDIGVTIEDTPAGPRWRIGRT
jgi:cysteinyl-tRNA synthetase